MSYSFSSMMNAGLFVRLETPASGEHVRPLPAAEYANVLAPNLIPTSLLEPSDHRKSTEQPQNESLPLNLCHEFMRLRTCGQDGHVRRPMPEAFPANLSDRHVHELDLDSSARSSATSSAQDTARVLLERRLGASFGALSVADVGLALGKAASSRRSLLTPEEMRHLERRCFGDKNVMMPVPPEPGTEVAPKVITNAQACGLGNSNTEVRQAMEDVICNDILNDCVQDMLNLLVRSARSEIQREHEEERRAKQAAEAKRLAEVERLEAERRAAEAQKREAERRVAEAQRRAEAERAEAERRIELERARKVAEKKQRREQRKVDSETFADRVISAAVDEALFDIAREELDAASKAAAQTAAAKLAAARQPANVPSYVNLGPKPAAMKLATSGSLPAMVLGPSGHSMATAGIASAGNGHPMAYGGPFAPSNVFPAQPVPVRSAVTQPMYQGGVRPAIPTSRPMPTSRGDFSGSSGIEMARDSKLHPLSHEVRHGVVPTAGPGEDAFLSDPMMGVYSQDPFLGGGHFGPSADFAVDHMFGFPSAAVSERNAVESLWGAGPSSDPAGTWLDISRSGSTGASSASPSLLDSLWLDSGASGPASGLVRGPSPGFRRMPHATGADPSHTFNELAESDDVNTDHAESELLPSGLFGDGGSDGLPPFQDPLGAWSRGPP